MLWYSGKDEKWYSAGEKTCLLASNNNRGGGEGPRRGYHYMLWCPTRREREVGRNKQRRVKGKNKKPQDPSSYVWVICASCGDRVTKRSTLDAHSQFLGISPGRRAHQGVDGRRYCRGKCIADPSKVPNVVALEEVADPSITDSEVF